MYEYMPSRHLESWIITTFARYSFLWRCVLTSYLFKTFYPQAIKEGRPIATLESGRNSRQELGSTTLSLNSSIAPATASPPAAKNGSAKNGSAKSPPAKKVASQNSRPIKKPDTDFEKTSVGCRKFEGKRANRLSRVKLSLSRLSSAVPLAGVSFGSFV